MLSKHHFLPLLLHNVHFPCRPTTVSFAFVQLYFFFLLELLVIFSFPGRVIWGVAIYVDT